jgi:hypothetical protein
MKKDLDYYLQEIAVQEVDSDLAINNKIPNLIGWYAVVNEKGIIAYFGNEKDAFRFRLDYINQLLNSIKL